MTPGTSSTIAQLPFTAGPKVDRARIANDLDGALGKCAPDSPRMSGDHADMAILDVQGSRIVMSLAAGLPGQHAACLTVSVGYGPLLHKSTSLAQRQGANCLMIADRVRSRYPSDDLRLHKGPAIVTSEVIDSLIDALKPTPTPLEAVIEQLSAAIGTATADKPIRPTPGKAAVSLRERARTVLTGLRYLSGPRNGCYGLPA